MGNQRNSRKEVASDEVLAQSRQLAISLKFHQRETLRKIPLELAIRAMTEVWSSCHPEDTSNKCSGISTAIITQEQAAKAIRESKFFSD